MPKWRRPGANMARQRFEIYRQWIAEDIAGMLAYRIPVNSEVGQELLRIMRERVETYLEENPDTTREEAVDNVTTDVISEVELGLIDEEIEWALYYLVSP
jgi:hypothetical protein